MNGALAKATWYPGARKRMIDNGADPMGNTQGQRDAYLKSEVAKGLNVGGQAGIEQE
jgi:hypothetical protein